MYAENIRINDADFQLHEPNIHILFCQSLKSSDIDECSSDLSTCDEDAFCFNIEGSHGCICQQGFTGNGTTCEGKCAKYRRLNKKIKRSSLRIHSCMRNLARPGCRNLANSRMTKNK